MNKDFKATLKRMNNFILDTNEIHSLNMLYKPITQSSILNYYFTLYENSFLSMDFSSIDLIDTLCSNDEKIDFKKALEVLTCVRLLEVENNVITLYPPYSPKKFFMYKFSEYLRANTSNVQFNKILEYFDIKVEVGYPTKYNLKELLEIPLKETKPKISKTDKEMIDYIKGHKPFEILSDNFVQISSSDRNTIDRLKRELSLNDDIISLLILYSLSTNDNKLHNFRYYETIIKDWERKNIKTVEDALMHIDSLYKEKPKKEIKSSQEWFDDYWKKIKEENK